MLAIWLALQWVEEIKSLKTIICSDSIIIRHFTVQSHRKQKGYPHEKTASSVQSSGDGPGSGVYVGSVNSGVLRNELADKKAKEATNYTNIDLVTNFSKTEIRDIVKKRIFKKLANVVG